MDGREISDELLLREPVDCSGKGVLHTAIPIHEYLAGGGGGFESLFCFVLFLLLLLYFVLFLYFLFIFAARPRVVKAGWTNGKRRGRRRGVLNFVVFVVGGADTYRCYGRCCPWPYNPKAALHIELHL